MRVVLLYLPFFLCFLGSCVAQSTENSVQSEPSKLAVEDTIPVNQRLNDKLKTAKAFLKKNPSFDQKIVIMIDMRVPSKNYRFFVVNMDSLKIIKKGLVAHGSGSETGLEDSLKFSNVPNSYCTSLGKYKIGASYIGNFGRSYKLHGLEATNNKAYERAVVFHRYMCVPDAEQTEAICNSLGCPMVSENFFMEVDEIIKKSGKPILMEIYY